MTANIESRIEKLEARLMPVEGELKVVFLVGIAPDGVVDEPRKYSDGDGNELHRECGESLETFQRRAVEWARELHPPKIPYAICVLF
jgi:hypothetical protein